MGQFRDLLAGAAGLACHSCDVCGCCVHEGSGAACVPRGSPVFREVPCVRRAAVCHMTLRTAVCCEDSCVPRVSGCREAGGAAVCHMAVRMAMYYESGHVPLGSCVP